MNTDQIIETEENTEVVAVKDESGKKTTKRIPRRSFKFVPSVVVSGRDGRVRCAGGCGTLVLKKIGECRKCRRARLVKGKRIVAKVAKEQRKSQESPE